MKNLDLDYAVNPKPYPIWLRLTLLVVALLLAGSLVLRYQQWQALNSAQQAARFSAMPASTAWPSNPALDETLLQAWNTQKNLNFPWLHMLSSLEEVKAQHANIELLSVTPNKAKAEIMLLGEAKNFDDITQLLNTLKANTAFGDAVLVNQHLVEEVESGRKKGKLIYVFSLKLNWRQ